MNQPSGRRRLGAYVLAADSTWLRSSIARYYDHIDVLVISAAADDRGWTGAPIRAQECVGVVKSMDTRGIARVVDGFWTDRTNPIAAETQQRTDAIAALAHDVDWVLQIDSDEILPSFDVLARVIEEAERRGLGAVEWPMRVLYRRLCGGAYLEVCARGGGPRYEYPGPIAMRPAIQLEYARRTAGAFLRPVVQGDDQSTQIVRPAEDGEVRAEILDQHDAILHNSWARDAKAVRRKIGSWGHNQGWRSWVYYYRWWLPAPLRWRRMRDFHPFVPPLWPALRRTPPDVDALLVAQDRHTKRLA